MIHEYPESVIVSFGGHKFEVTDLVIEEPPRRAMLYKSITLKLTTVDTTRGLRRMMNRPFPYLTPRKRRRIKRRAERDYLEHVAIHDYGVSLIVDESTPSLRARCQERIGQ